MVDFRAAARFSNFSAQAIVDQEINYTILGGHFIPILPIDLTRQVVILYVCVAGDRDFRLSLSAGSFRETVFGGYVAHVIYRLFETDILLQPFSRGDWAYSAGIGGFAPGSTPVTVSLMIGNQAGRVAVKVYAF
jgi:hypothetical protein